MTRTTTRLVSHAVPAVALGAALATLLLLAGCSSGSSSASAAGGKTSANSSRAAAGNRFAAGLAGSIASVGNGSFTLTPASGTTDTVDWTSSTTFTRTASGSMASVTAGSCVAVTEASGSDASTGSVDATAVRVSPPVNGACTPGAAGGAGRTRPGNGGGAGGGAGGTGAPGGRFGARSMLAGSVDSVSASSFVVVVTTPGASSGGSGSTTTTVDVSGSTAFTVTTAASATDLSVGECARVFSGARRASTSGSTATSSAAPPGPVTAVSVTLSAPMNGSCSGGTRAPSSDGTGAAPSRSAGATA